MDSLLETRSSTPGSPAMKTSDRSNMRHRGVLWLFIQEDEILRALLR